MQENQYKHYVLATAGNNCQEMFLCRYHFQQRNDPDPLQPQYIYPAMKQTNLENQIIYNKHQPDIYNFLHLLTCLLKFLL